MAPFGIPRPGFCMVFQRASFVFSCPGQTFDAGIGFFDLGATFWPGDILGVKNGSRKKMDLRRNHFLVAVQGEFRNPNELYYI